MATVGFVVVCEGDFDTEDSRIISDRKLHLYKTKSDAVITVRSIEEAPNPHCLQQHIVAEVFTYDEEDD